MIRLWQRNLIGAGVSAAALLVIGVSTLGPDWSHYRQSTTAEHTVAEGDSGFAAGQSWRIAAVRSLTSPPKPWDPELPPGTVIQVVVIERSDGAGPIRCDGRISDGHRQWASEVGGGYGPLPPEGTSSTCGTPGPVQFSFVLPRDVTPTFVDVMDGSGLILVRLTL